MRKLLLLSTVTVLASAVGCTSNRNSLCDCGSGCRGFNLFGGREQPAYAAAPAVGYCDPCAGATMYPAQGAIPYTVAPQMQQVQMAPMVGETGCCQ